MIDYLKRDNNSYRIACTAGREVFVTALQNNTFQRDFYIKAVFNDWILNIKYLDDGSIAAVTAHNIALLLAIEENQLVIKQKLKCDNNSTLYCSHIHGNLWNNLTFFGGTALGELVIWKQRKEKDERAETLYQHGLHNGVIFSIDFCGKYVLTGSDDRSIKVFKCDKSFNKLTEIFQLFGHTSRVFVSRVIIFNENVKFVSAGEDGNICIWNENGTLQKRMNISASGGIWNLDYDPKNSVIITSSSTGRLNKFLLNKIFFEKHTLETPSSYDPAKIIYLKNDTLCVVDTKVQIFTKNIAPQSEWNKAETPEINCKIVAIDAFDNRLFLAAKNSIWIYDFCDISNKLNFTSELNMDEKFSLPNNKLEYFFRAIHALNRNEIFISEMNGSCFVIDVQQEVVKNLFKIPTSIEPWTTCVKKYNDDYWIIADRVGSLFLYRNECDDLSKFQLPLFKVSGKHNHKFGIKTIRVLKDGFIETSGIGGTIKTHFVNTKTDTIETYKSNKTIVNSIEKIKTCNEKDFALGFNDEYFVVLVNREVVYERKCGGRHRQWDIVKLVNKKEDGDDEDDCKLRLSYISRKQVNCVDFYVNDFTFDMPHGNSYWHTKDCNAVRMIDDAKILISVGEDTLLKLTKIEMMENDVSFVESIADVKSHISCIWAITSWMKGDDLNIISVGGRAQIVLTRFIQMRYVKEEINFMLTGSLLPYVNAKNNTFDPETKFTCVYFNEKIDVLFVGCSDGYIRAFKLIYTEFSTSLKLMFESFYGKCILQLSMIENFIILSMATDGAVCFWYFDEPQQSIRVIEKLNHNQNGINSFDIFAIDDSFYKIATAGDDNDIYATEFTIDGDYIKFCKTIKSYGVHIAQVTGIKFLSRYELLSASIDQTLCKLKITDDKFEIVDKKFTCISDVKGFLIVDRKFIIIYGAGLETLKFF